MKEKNIAQQMYEAAKAMLAKYCEEETELEPVIQDEEYPIRVLFLPCRQQTMFGNENVSEDGEVNDLTVTVGLTTTVKSTLKFKMDSKSLKKLIKLSEKVGHIYYQAFREAAGDRTEAKVDDEITERLRLAVESASAAEDEKETAE